MTVKYDALALFAGAALLTCQAHALDRAIQIDNLSPQAIVFGMVDLQPTLVQKPLLTLQHSVSNQYVFEREPAEGLVLDGEINQTRLTLAFPLALGDWDGDGNKYRLELFSSLAFIHHGEGSLDGFIVNWHDWFGLPDGGRADLNSNEFRYQYARDNQLVLDRSSPASGISDWRFGLRYGFELADDMPLVLQAQIELPTGDAVKFTGNEEVDGGAGISGSLTAGGLDELTVYYGGGINYVGQSRFGGARSGTVIDQLHWVANARTGLAYDWPEAALAWRASLQLDYHSRLFRSELEPLYASAMQLSVTGSLQLAEGTRLQAGISEDVRPRISPDFVFFLSLIQYADWL